MLIELLLSVQLQTYPRAELQKTVETKQETMSATDADPNIRKLAEAGSNLELIEKGKVAFVIVESNAERIEREKKEEEERLRRERESASKRNVAVNSGYYGGYEVVGYSTDQCVIYYKKMSGKTGSLGYAGYIQPQGYEPKVGAGALESGHISYVVAVNDNSVTVQESNFVYGYITRRTIPLDKLRGFIY